MSTCRSCDAEVIFVPSLKTGRPMILNAEPRKDVVLTLGIAFGLASRASVGNPDLRADVVDVFTDHHSTCPAAKDWAGRVFRPPIDDEDGGRRGD